MSPSVTRRWLLWFSVLAVTAVALLAGRARLDKSHVALAFLLVVLAGSAAEGRALGVSLAAVAFMAFNWFFLRPYNTFVITDPLDWLVLLAFLITGVVAAELLERQRRATSRAEQRAAEIDRLAILGARTLTAPRAEDALDAIATVIREAMLAERCEIFSWDHAAGLRLAGRSPNAEWGDEHAELLTYTVEHSEPAAQRADGTLSILSDVLTTASDETSRAPVLADLLALGIPLSVQGRVVGALRLSSSQPFGVSDDQRRVLRALSYYAALGVERVRLATAEQEADGLRRADRFKDALLAAVSHDLRTPLTAIKGIANEVWRGGDPMRAQVIEEEADRLAIMVNELLELSQINAGVLKMDIELNAVDDVVGVALERVESAHGAQRITVRIAHDDAILVGEFDFTHTVRALTNLLENAIKYGAPNAAVILAVEQKGDRLSFSIEDSGPGVPSGDEERIFQPFYRSATVPDSVRGTGLGLSIARQLVEAQGGTLRYERRESGGSRFVVELPSATVPSL
ncbi:MAG: ATP-binding protein [Gemmatimonadota bacterium]